MHGPFGSEFNVSSTIVPGRRFDCMKIRPTYSPTMPRNMAFSVIDSSSRIVVVAKPRGQLLAEHEPAEQVDHQQKEGDRADERDW